MDEKWLIPLKTPINQSNVDNGRSRTPNTKHTGNFDLLLDVTRSLIVKVRVIHKGLWFVVFE